MLPPGPTQWYLVNLKEVSIMVLSATEGPIEGSFQRSVMATLEAARPRYAEKE